MEHGSWCWNKVVSHLRSLGHEVITPDLPGHYRNQHDFRDVSLASYVSSIETILLANPKPVVLVGHSMVGVIVTQVAENMPNRIDHLIYVSAFIPENGGSLMDEERQATMSSVATAVIVDEENASLSLDFSKALRDLILCKLS